MPTRVLVPSGVLGLGFDGTALERGLGESPDIIAIDGGSTDSGPFYLGTGTSKYSRSVCLGEWREIMDARRRAGVPLVIGSCGTCGSRNAVDWMFEITRQVAEESGESLRVARLYCDRSVEEIRQGHASGDVAPLDPAPEISDASLAAVTNVVALAGAEQMTTALEAGVEVVLAGRATDTAGIAAMPLARGEHPGAAWHGAKIAECGAFCTDRPSSGVVMVDFDATGCTVMPMAEGARCTPRSVAAHMLYENADPFVLHEPGGHLDVTNATYEDTGDGQVRVEGAKWVKADDYRVKLEAARLAGYQTMMLAVLRDQRYVAEARRWSDELLGHCRALIARMPMTGRDDHDIDLRLIGVDAALGDLEFARADALEVGVMILITAASQELATEIASVINPHLLHFPLAPDEPLPTFVFPVSPVHCERGAVYEFALNHVIRLDDPMQGFDLRIDEVGGGQA